MDALEYLETEGWQVVGSLQIPPRERELVSFDDLPLCKECVRYLRSSFPDGIYCHQRKAIEYFLEGNDVCITTGTASGKSAVFYMAAIERLVNKPDAKIIAVYPLKALGREQEKRWKEALKRANINPAVGRIDGQVLVSERINILKRSNVLIMTPDIMHAWLLPSLDNQAVAAFLKMVSLIVVDEIHNYTGVFGSNAAFLFRRLRHLMDLLYAKPRFICASATIAVQEEHLKKLLGLEFVFVNADLDSSPRYRLDVNLIRPPRTHDLLSNVSAFLSFIAADSTSRFLTFVDSRKQTEHISSIIARKQDKDEEEATERNLDYFERLDVLPYRAGYEEHDRDEIQDRLSKGKLKGVISTSALELGIDIPHLNVGVLVGVPRSATSLHQRIGRVGRNSEGTIYIISTGDVYDEAVFRNPEQVLERPFAEGALYLENQRIQYLHALCLARHGGEHDKVVSILGATERTELLSLIDWPNGFIDLCNKERKGEISSELRGMKAEAGEDPNHVFPLRDVESQYAVELVQGPERRRLGSLSHGQLMREAYPGAIYYYATRPFRVYRVDTYSKKVNVRNEKKYTTQPQFLPSLVFPNLSREAVYCSRAYGDLLLIDCILQIQESVCGFKERRGPNEFVCSYPIDMDKTGVSYNYSKFTRNIFTTGIVMSHPILCEQGVNGEEIARLLYEAFLILVPFERRDINYATDRFRTSKGPVQEGHRFIAIYDQTYGSLRLSARILEESILRQSLEEAVQLIENDESVLSEETINAARELQISSLEEWKDVDLGFGMEPTEIDECEIIIIPGSKGLSRVRDGENYIVESVFFNPRQNCLFYKGRYDSDGKDVTTAVPVESVEEIPGISELGYYRYDTGSIEPIE